MRKQSYLEIYISVIVIIVAVSCTRSNKVENNNFVFGRKTTIRPKQETPFKNPVLIYGSSFGHYFQTLYKLSKYEEMIKFTSSKTIAKYGRGKLLNMYEKLDFAIPLKLINMTNDSTTGNFQLTYETSIVATNRIFRMQVRLENDSAKLLSCDLKGFPFIKQ